LIIIDDHAILRFGLELLTYICPEIEIVGDASNGLEGLHLCEELQPDVVLLDLFMPGMNGIETCSSIRQVCPHTKIVIMTSFVDDSLVQKALLAGATSYILKNVTPTELSKIILAAHQGKTTLAAEATQVLIHAQTAPENPNLQLTRREKEVLELMSKGLTNPEIASHLTVTLSTVKKHVSKVLEKLNASTRTEAVAFAIAHDLLTDSKHTPR
jgi:NarL family two-component system response regulator LiaR